MLREIKPGFFNEALARDDYLFRFDSVDAFLRALEQTDAVKIHLDRYKRDGRSESKAWFGNVTPLQAIKLAHSGDASIVPQAEALLAQIDDAAIHVPLRQWGASPAGAYPVVPEVLAGSPTPMRRYLQDPSEHGTISVYVGVNSSSAYDAPTLLKRGVAILALVSKLQAIRPVELHVVSTVASGAMIGFGSNGPGNFVTTMRVDTKPLDLAVAGYFLAHCGFDRRLNHALAESLTAFNGGWALALSQGKIPTMLGLGPKDIWIEPAHLDDKMIRQPVEWVNAQIAAAMNEAELDDREEEQADE